MELLPHPQTRYRKAEKGNRTNTFKVGTERKNCYILLERDLTNNWGGGERAFSLMGLGRILQVNPSSSSSSSSSVVSAQNPNVQSGSVCSLQSSTNPSCPPQPIPSDLPRALTKFSILSTPICLFWPYQSRSCCFSVLSGEALSVVRALLVRWAMEGNSGGGSEVELMCKTLQVEHKLFYFDLKENPRGQYLKISEKTSATRSTIIVPSSGIPWFLDLFNNYVDSDDQDICSKELQLDTKALVLSLLTRLFPLLSAIQLQACPPTCQVFHVYADGFPRFAFFFYSRFFILTSGRTGGVDSWRQVLWFTLVLLPFLDDDRRIQSCFCDLYWFIIGFDISFCLCGRSFPYLILKT